MISLNLDVAEAKAMRKIAKAKGIPDAELMHVWVREKIHATGSKEWRVAGSRG